MLTNTTKKQPKSATKREQLKRINGLIKELQNESNKRMNQDLENLSKPYYFKGRFNSLSSKAKKEKIKEYYKQEKQETKNAILDLFNNAPKLISFCAKVEWSKNRTWGMNPSARVWINNSGYAEGHASGCGYDKLSACICYAVNNSENKKIIIAELLRSFAKFGNPFPYGVYKSSKIYLHFDGCGVSTLREILKYCGLENWQHYESKTSDYINADNKK